MSHGSQVSLHRRLWRHQRQLFQRWNLRQSLEISPWRSQPRWAWHMRRGPKRSVPTWMSGPFSARGLDPSASPWTQWPKASWHIGRSASMKSKGSIAGTQEVFPTMDSPGIFRGHRKEMFKMITAKTASNATITYLLHHPINHSGIPSFFPTPIKTRCLIDPLVDLHPNQTGGFPGSPTRCRCYDQRSVRYWRHQCIQQGAGRAVDGWRVYMGQNSQAPIPVMANKYYVSCILKFDEIWILELLMICTYTPYMVRSQCILYVYIC